MGRPWNKEVVVQEVGQKQEKERREGEQLKNTGKMKAGRKKARES